MSGIWWSSARQGERQRTNGRKLKEEWKGRYEGGRDGVRRQGSNNKRGMAGDISPGQVGLKE